MKYLSRLVLLAMAVVLIGRAAEADVTEPDFRNNLTIRGCFYLLEAIDARTFRDCKTYVGDEVDKLRGGVCVGGMMWHEKYSDQDFIDVEACLRAPWGTQPEGVVNESVESALRPAHDATLATSPSTVVDRDNMGRVATIEYDPNRVFWPDAYGPNECLPKVEALKSAMTKFQEQARTCKKSIKEEARGSHLERSDGTVIERLGDQRKGDGAHGMPDMWVGWWVGFEENCYWCEEKPSVADTAAPDGICLDWGHYYDGHLSTELGGEIHDGDLDTVKDEYGRSWWHTEQVSGLNKAWKEAQEACNFLPGRAF